MTPGASGGKITVVLPVRLFDVVSDIKRLIEINLMSIEVFFDKGALEELIIVASSDDLDLIEKAIEGCSLGFAIQLLNENDVLPCLHYRSSRRLSNGWSGWRIQQVLKMLVVKFIRTEHYLLLDDDVMATRSVRSEDLFRDGKMCMSYLSCSHHSVWFRSSAAVLKMPLDFEADELVMNVTPQLISTRHMRGLLQYIQELWGVKDVGLWLMQLSGLQIGLTSLKRLNWLYAKFTILFGPPKSPAPDDCIACGQWTEYTLYWLYIRSLGVQWALYSLQEPQLADRGIWTDDEASEFCFDRWASETLGEAHRHCFCVISSKIKNIDREKLYGRLRNYLNNAVKHQEKHT